MKPVPVCMETDVPSDELIVSHTNLYGIITYANEAFAEISGYDADDLIGQPHNIVRHPDMPSSVFSALWETLKNESSWSGYIKNLRQDGGFYWVHAQVSRLFDKNGILIGYKSLRSAVEKQKRHELERYYALLKETEENKVKLCEWIDKEVYEQILRKSQTEHVSPGDVLKNVLIKS